MRKLNIAFLGLLMAAASIIYGQDFDPGFQPFITRPGDVQQLLPLPDGGFLVAGSFSLANRASQEQAARFRADGSLDDSFQPALSFSVTALAVQEDGKVLLGGSPIVDGAAGAATLLRLHTDGSPDSAFQAGSAPDGTITNIIVESSGTILVGGSFSSFSGQPSQGVARLSSEGALQEMIPLQAGTVFVTSLLLRDNGRFVVGGTTAGQAYLSYHEYDGSPVSGFQFSPSLPGENNYMIGIRSLALDNSGRLVLTAGTFLIRYTVATLRANGSIDNWGYLLGVPQALAVGPGGDIYIAGDYGGLSAVHTYSRQAGLQVYNGGGGADGLIRNVRFLNDGSMLIGGNFSSFNGEPALGLARLNANGQPVPGFHASIERPGVIRTILRAGPESVYISGDFAMAGAVYSPGVARLLLANGQADPAFTNPGISYRNEIRKITLDGQGRLLCAGTNLNNADSPGEAPVLRLLPNGNYDPSFQADPGDYPLGRIDKVQTLANGQILAIGEFNIINQGLAASRIALFNADGSLDRAFSNRIQASAATEILLQKDGKALIGGRDIRYDGAPPTPLLRLHTSLERDDAFQADSRILCEAGCRFKLTEQEDGRLLLGGIFKTDPDAASSFGMVRLQTGGNIDESLHLPATFRAAPSYADGGVRKMEVFPDGRILVVGLFDTLGTLPAPSMYLLEENGNPLPGLSLPSAERQLLFDAIILNTNDFLVGGILSGQAAPGRSGLAIVTGAPLAAPAIIGTVETPFGQAVEGVEISITGDASLNMLTDETGSYAFEDAQAGLQYTVSAMLGLGHREGVSALDLLLITRHIMGVAPIQSPYLLIAADVNRSRSLTTLDLIGIQRLILGLDTAFPNNTSWRFVDAGYSFPNPANPWQEAFPENIQIGELPAGGAPDASFIALKTGDVNGDALPGSLAAEGREREAILQAPDALLSAGSRVEVPIEAVAGNKLAALQLTLNFDRDALELVSINYGLAGKENLNEELLQKGWLPMVWCRQRENEAEAAPFFTFTFRGKKAGKLSQWLSVGSQATQAEAYHEDGRRSRPELAFRPLPAAPGRLILHQNAPNPFSGPTTISFQLEQPGPASLSIYQPDGREAFRASRDCSAGYQEWKLDSSRLPYGLLFYTLQAQGETQTRRMFNQGRAE